MRYVVYSYMVVALGAGRHLNHRLAEAKGMSHISGVVHHIKLRLGVLRYDSHIGSTSMDRMGAGRYLSHRLSDAKGMSHRSGVGHHIRLRLGDTV
jgi:hypothetical protein